MRVSETLCQHFADDFARILQEFALERELILQADDLRSKRFINRSLVPHVKKLSDLFNRIENETQSSPTALENLPYWSSSSNPKNLRLAYLLAFLPGNAFRMAAVIDELQRWGYAPEAKSKVLSARKILELGSGPATGSLGACMAFKNNPLPDWGKNQWTLVDQDQTSLDWGQALLSKLGENARSYRYKIPSTLQLPTPIQGPYDLILSSYFLNELEADAAVLAKSLANLWKHNLQKPGLMILVEPALKVQSQKLLRIRQALIQELQSEPDFQILLPCLGQQVCGALAGEDDWCHEEVHWQRPEYLTRIDQLSGLDRRRLPFSYLVIARGKTELSHWLPQFQGPTTARQRLVSPSYRQGRDLEFYLCGQAGKNKVRMRTKLDLQRGDILEKCELRGDVAAGRVDQAETAAFKNI